MKRGLPTVDISFFIDILSKSKKVKGSIVKGNSVSYVISGSKPIGERIVVIRNVDGQVDYEFATATAIKIKCMSELLDWLVKNRRWKDGGYFEETSLHPKRPNSKASQAEANP